MDVFETLINVRVSVASQPSLYSWPFGFPVVVVVFAIVHCVLISCDALWIDGTQRAPHAQGFDLRGACLTKEVGTEESCGCCFAQRVVSMIMADKNFIVA